MATVVLHNVIGETQEISAHDTGRFFVVLVLKLLVVAMAEGFKVSEELGQTATLHATGQMEYATTSGLCAIYACIRVATVPAFLEEAVRD